MFGPRQVGEIMIGNTVASESTINTFIANAADKSLTVLSVDGTNVAANKPFKVFQKATNAKGSFEFSDTVIPKNVEYVRVTAYTPEVAGVYKVDGFNTAGAVAINRTYEVRLKLINGISPENWEDIAGYYVTGLVLGTDTATTVRDGVMKSLQKSLNYRGMDEFKLAIDGTGFTITEVLQDNTPGKDPGRKLRFEITASVFEMGNLNGLGGNLGVLSVAEVTAPKAGSGTGKWVTEYEWFAKGYKYDENRYGGYPADFMGRVPFYGSKSGMYNVITLGYYSTRTETLVERQWKELQIVVAKATDTLANNANTNTLLGKINTALANSGARVDAALPVE